MACPMVLIRKGKHTNRSTENGLTNQNTKTKIGAEIRKEIIRANTGIRTRKSIDIAPVLLKTKKSMMAAIIRIRTRTERVPRLVRTRSTRVAVHPAKIRIRIRTRAETKNIITNQARAPKIKTGKMRKVSCKILI